MTSQKNVCEGGYLSGRLFYPWVPGRFVAVQRKMHPPFVPRHAGLDGISTGLQNFLRSLYQGGAEYECLTVSCFQLCLRDGPLEVRDKGVKHFLKFFLSPGFSFCGTRFCRF